MYMTLKLCLIGFLVGGCSGLTATRPQQAEQEVVPLAATTPGFIQGQAIDSASIASTLAELVLAQQGVDTRGRQVKISYFEGVYSVVFARSADEKLDCYTVEIAAADSKVLKVTRSRPLPS
jgi:hypothetical protein